MSLRGKADEARSTLRIAETEQTDRNKIFLENHEIQICAGCAYISGVDSSSAGYLDRLAEWIALLPNSGYNLADGERYHRHYEIVRRQVLDHQAAICAACAFVNAGPNRKISVNDLERVRRTYNQHHPSATVSRAQNGSLGYWRDQNPVIQRTNSETLRNNKDRASVPCPLVSLEDGADEVRPDLRPDDPNSRNFSTMNKKFLREEYGIYIVDD